MLSRFHSIKLSGDVRLGPRDEIYWAKSAGADSQHETTHRTGEFESIEGGSQRNFLSNAVQDMVHQGVAGNIQCWEADDNSSAFLDGLHKALQGTAKFCIDAAVKAAEAYDWGDHSGRTGKAAAILALTAGVQRCSNCSWGGSPRHQQGRPGMRALNRLGCR